MLQCVTEGLYYHIGTTNTNLIAAFDLDWTIIRTFKGRFPKDNDDWKFLPNRLKTLKEYNDAGYTLVIFTNQRYKGKKLETAIARINNVINDFNINGINPWIFVATNDIYRKPSNNMWVRFSVEYSKYSKDHFNREKSFYIGDAAGRPSDFSSDDILFAENSKLNFFTPEQIFINNTLSIPTTQTMYIFMGMPGSGKTSYFMNNLQPLGYIHVSSDILKTKSKILNTAEQSLAQGKSIAIDATNPKLETRREYVNLAIKYKVPTLIIYFVSNGYERNKLREHPVPDIAYSVYYKNLEEPTLEKDLVPFVQLN